MFFCSSNGLLSSKVEMYARDRKDRSRHLSGEGDANRCDMPDFCNLGISDGDDEQIGR